MSLFGTLLTGSAYVTSCNYLFIPELAIAQYIQQQESETEKQRHKLRHDGQSNIIYSNNKGVNCMVY